MSKLVLFNKPYNVLSQFTDSEGRSTLADYLQQDKVYPAGRLDYDSEGLLILTDDGKLQHQISNPAAKMNKTYWVQIEGEPTEQDLIPLRQGILLNDGPCRPATVKHIDEPALWPRKPAIRQRQSIPTCWLEITISEGRNRQVRRMTAAIGFPTLRLVRYSIGQWQLDDLAPGQYRELTVHAPKTRAGSRGRRKHTANKARGV